MADIAIERELVGLYRQLWRRRATARLMRGLWLGLLAVAAGLAGALWLGWSWQPAAWVGAGLAVFGIAAVSIFFPSRSRVELARRMDRRLGLMDRMVTALEVGRKSEPGAIGQQLLQQAESSVHWLTEQVRARSAVPWREIEMVAIMALVVAGLALYSTLDTRLPGRSALALPPLGHEPAPPTSTPTATPRGNQRPTPTPTGSNNNAARPEDVRKALEELGKALQDQAPSSQAGESLGRGDTDGAGENLRRLADQEGNLSSEAKQGIAEALRQAAGKSPPVPELQQAEREAAEALESGDNPAAAKALEDLAGQVQELGKQLEQQANQDQGQPRAGQESGGQQPGVKGQPAGNKGEQGNLNNPENDGQTNGSQPSAQGAAGAGGNEGATHQESRTRSERLPGQGQPLELNGSTQADQATITQPSTATNAIPGQGEAGDAGQTFESPSANAVDSGSDRLSYPWDLRDVVQDYFAPK